MTRFGLSVGAALACALALASTSCDPPAAPFPDAGGDAGCAAARGRICAAGEVCVPGVGCAACTPTQTRCAEGAFDSVQRCTAAGAWEQVACDAARGQRCVAGACVDPCAAASATYLGCEYWPTITANSGLSPAFAFAVAVANPQPYPVRVVLEGGRLAQPLARTLAPGAVDAIELPPVPALSQNSSDGVLPRSCDRPACPASSALVPGGAYHLRADAPVAAYQFNPLAFRSEPYPGSYAYSYTNDASLLLPARALTAHYVVATRANWPLPVEHGAAPVFGGFVTVVPVGDAAEPTTVRVRLTAAVAGGEGVAASGAGERVFTVPRGAALQLVGSRAGEDLTGSAIDASGPVAVFVGHDCTQVPDGEPACDHLEEQLLPSETWGRAYAVAQPRARGADESFVVRVVSRSAGNRLTFEGLADAPAACAAPLGAGAFCEFVARESLVVRGTEPLLVMLFMRGQGEPAMSCPPEEDRPECMGDPAMATAVPLEQFRRRYDVLVPATYTRSFVSVVGPASARVALDGVALPAPHVALGDGLGVWSLPIAPGRHRLEAPTDAERFGVEVYGVARYTSYMYPGGLDLAPIAPP